MNRTSISAVLEKLQFEFQRVQECRGRLWSSRQPPSQPDRGPACRRSGSSTPRTLHWCGTKHMPTNIGNFSSFFCARMCALS
jgi:hypothetical protein